MDSNFLKKSQHLLLKFLREPGWFSFFPSSYFWNKELSDTDIQVHFKKYFTSEYLDFQDDNNKMNLYIHIPFCSKICSYCNCFKRQLKEEDEIDIYIKYLEKEIKIINNLNYKSKIKINSIFIWGWTPNLLSVEQFQKLYWLIIKYFDLEDLEQFLLDGHPNYYNKLKLDYLQSIWVNRLTFAIQTFDNKTLIQNNRDVYNINDFEDNIKYLNTLGIASNIDLLIWLKVQTFESIKKDIDYLTSLDINNVSVHYLMKSNNISYELDENYLDVILKTKKYLRENKLPHWSSNITEDNYASKRNTTLSIWSSAITNIYSEVIYSKPGIINYYKDLDVWKIPMYKWLQLSKRTEMIRFIYLNILYWININIFKELFWEEIFKVFINEFKFLNSNNIIYIKENVIYSQKSDLDTLTYFNIFFIEKVSELNKNNYNDSELKNFFLESWELIDK